MNLLKPRSVVQLLQPASRVPGLSLQNTRSYEKDATLALVDLNSLELYKESFSSAAIEDTVLDKCVNIIKRDNIQVPGVSAEASLNDWVRLQRSKVSRKVFPGLKVGFMTFKDRERIQEKAEDLRTSLRLEKDTF